MEQEKETPKEIEDDVIVRLSQCYESCLSGLNHSLEQGGDYVTLEHIRWLFDCAEICKMSESFLIRNSEYAGDILNTCSYICDDCAESCETFFEDEHMRNCAEVCRNCAASCRDTIMSDDEEQEDEEEQISGQ